MYVFLFIYNYFKLFIIIIIILIFKIFSVPRDFVDEAKIGLWEGPML